LCINISIYYQIILKIKSNYFRNELMLINNYLKNLKFIFLQFKFNFLFSIMNSQLFQVPFFDNIHFTVKKVYKLNGLNQINFLFIIIVNFFII
jgi:hypothetical protein